MTRKDFIEQSLIMGVGIPFLSTLFLQSCDEGESIFPRFKTSFSGKVLIVGAGAAGLAAGYLLKYYGVDFEIIEANPVYGGRLKKTDDFADFPIDIGAEWIHTDPKILADIANDPRAREVIDIIVYNPQTVQSWKNGKMRSHNYISKLYSEWKFKNSTWFDFFEQWIVPEIADKILLNRPVTAINYETDKIILKTTTDDLYEADKVLITSSVKMLQNGYITFLPALPHEKTEAFRKIDMGDGIKIFIEFREKFYPDILAFGNIFQALQEEEKFVYDAAFSKGSKQHILGLFAINEKASAYTKLPSEEAIISTFLAELDVMFDGKASANYVKHIIENWSEEPFIQGAYSYTFDGDQKQIVAAITRPIMDRIYFAGEALSIDKQAMVHGACESAYRMVATMLRDA